MYKVKNKLSIMLVAIMLIMSITPVVFAENNVLETILVKIDNETIISVPTEEYNRAVKLENPLYHYLAGEKGWIEIFGISSGDKYITLPEYNRQMKINHGNVSDAIENANPIDDLSNIYVIIGEVIEGEEPDLKPIIDPVEEVTVVSVEDLADIETEFGVMPELPGTVEITLSNDDAKTVSVTWNTEDLNINEAGTYPLEGELNLADLDVEPTNLKAKINVIVLEEVIEDPTEIINIKPSENITLAQGEELTISFNAPAGGQAYFRMLMPTIVGGTTDAQPIGQPMVEESPTFYKGTWTVPEGLVVEDIMVELIFISKENVRMEAVAEGKITVQDEIEIPIVDKTALRNLIADAEEKNEEDYTEESWLIFASALSEAKQVEASEESTQELVDSAVANLNAAINALEEKAETPVYTIIASFDEIIVRNFGYVRIEEQNVPEAAKFDVLYKLSDGIPEATDIVDLDDRTGSIFYDKAQYRTVTIRIYDADENLLHTFEDVELIPYTG